MAVSKHGGKGEYTCVVDRFEAHDLGAPFKVILNDAVRVTYSATGDMLSYKIPDLEGLICLVAMKRVLHRKKLNGPDIKFLRKAIGVKQKEMAQRIEISHEHLSRCEANALPLSPTAEKLLRIFAAKTAIKLHKLKSCKAKTDLEEAVDKLFDLIKPGAVSSVEDEHAPETDEWDSNCDREAA